MATNYPINPRVRAYGKARIDIALRALDAATWKRLWKAPQHPYPFHLGGAWKQCVEYKVDDFAAEVGFMIDILGLEVTALDSTYAQFSSPQADFFFSIVETPQGQSSTPPDALRIQFMVLDIFATTQELESRGITFELPPQPCQPGSRLHIGSFRTPHGISIELWGMVQEAESGQYTQDEQDLYALMTSNDEPEISALEELEKDADTRPDEQDEDEEFFPGLGEPEDDEEDLNPSEAEQDDDLEYIDDVDSA